jgi:CheY-like chemotaxis protein
MSNGADNARISGSVGCVLLVEDNMIIALDTEDVLHRAGIAKVMIAASADAALAVLAQERPDFALLDFNLGGETSARVAEALVHAGVPFCFATGYGEAMEGLALQAPCGVLKKPYSQGDVAEALARAAGTA